jgi:hypothetical protein
MEIMEENGMGLFAKSKTGVVRDAQQAAHRTWHNASLLSGRRHGLRADSEAKLAAAQAALEAKSALPSDEAGEFPDLAAERAEVERLQDVVSRRRREAEAADADLAVKKAALDEANAALLEEEFNHGPLERQEKALLALHASNQEIIKAQPDLRSRPDFSLPWLTGEVVEGWTREAHARTNPQPRRAIDPNCAVKFTHDTSGINGPLDGRRYNAGDGASFSPEVATRLVASGRAEWLIPNSQNTAAAEKAKRELTQRIESDGPRAVAGFVNG